MVMLDKKIRNVIGYARWYAYVIKKSFFPKKKKGVFPLLVKALELIEKEADFDLANSLADDFLEKKIDLGLTEASALFFMVSRSEELLDFARNNPNYCYKFRCLDQGEYKEYFKSLDVAYRGPSKKIFHLLRRMNVKWIESDDDIKNADRICVIEVGGVGDGIWSSAIYGFLQEISREYGVEVYIFTDYRLRDIYERTYEGLFFVPCNRNYAGISGFFELLAKGKLYNRLPKSSLSRYFDNDAHDEFLKFENIITNYGVICIAYESRCQYEHFFVEDPKKRAFFSQVLPEGKKCGVAFGSLNTQGIRRYGYNYNILNSILKHSNAKVALFDYGAETQHGKNIINLDMDKRNDFDSLLAVAKNLDIFVGDSTTNTHLAARAGCPTLLTTKGVLGEILFGENGDEIFFMRNVRGVNTLNLKDIGRTEEIVLDIVNSANPSQYIVRDVQQSINRK